MPMRKNILTRNMKTYAFLTKSKAVLGQYVEELKDAVKLLVEAKHMGQALLLAPYFLCVDIR